MQASLPSYPRGQTFFERPEKKSGLQMHSPPPLLGAPGLSSPLHCNLRESIFFVLLRSKGVNRGSFLEALPGGGLKTVVTVWGSKPIPGTVSP